MRRLKPVMLRLRDRWLLRLANWAASRVGLIVTPQADFSDAREILADLHDYATHSGHLRNRYKAGKRVRLMLGQIHAKLGRAWIPGKGPVS